MTSGLGSTEEAGELERKSFCGAGWGCRVDAGVGQTVAGGFRP